MDRNLLNKATSSDDAPTPGYMYDEVAKMTLSSYEANGKVRCSLVKFGPGCAPLPPPILSRRPTLSLSLFPPRRVCVQSMLPLSDLIRRQPKTNLR